MVNDIPTAILTSDPTLVRLRARAAELEAELASLDEAMVGAEDSIRARLAVDDAQLSELWRF